MTPQPPPAHLRGKSAQIVTLTVPAGEAIAGRATGAFLFMIETPIEVEWRMDGQPFIPAKSGATLKCLGESYFEWFEVRNPGTVDVVVRVFAGWSEFQDQRPYPLEPLTEYRGGNVLTLDALSSVTLPPKTAANIIRRKVLRISQGGGTGGGAIRCRSGQDEAGEFVWPWQTAEIPTADTVIIENLNAYEVEIGIGEVYWVTRPTPPPPPLS